MPTLWPQPEPEMVNTPVAEVPEAAGWTVLETQSADGWFAYTCRR